ncbi:cation transport protein-domain-containing protein [Gloeopeniophorella convolvens]|nr:cation transport protein-domain-containing protein [Gloeopeniophorella convolvens]
MPLPSDQPRPESSFQRLASWLRRHLNFYRLHIIYFTFTPLIFSAIFYASNGRYHIAYIDALFNSVSAMAVCGLATIDLSSLTPWQQVLLFFQMCLGSPVRGLSPVKGAYVGLTGGAGLSILGRGLRQKTYVHNPMRKHRAGRRAQGRLGGPRHGSQGAASLTSRFIALFSARSNQSTADAGEPRRLRPDMIRRMDDAPKLVNPSGWISEGHSDPIKVVAVEPPDEADSSSSEPNGRLSLVQESRTPSPARSDYSQESRVGRPPKREYHLSPNLRGQSAATSSGADRRMRRNTVTVSTDTDRPSQGVPMPRTQTIEFAPRPRPRHRPSPDRSRLDHPTISEMSFRRPTMDTLEAGTIRPAVSMHRSGTTHTYRSSAQRAKHSDFGGFPMPQDIILRLIRRFLPGIQRHLTRTVTMPRTTTITSIGGNTEGARAVPYISFDAVVGRNSVFKSLETEQLEELGGVEYRALNALLWIVGCYHIFVQLFAFTIIAPYMSINRWKEDFVPPQQHRPVNTSWFAIYQVVSAYTNTGTSLVDQSMVPFQRAYPMIFVLIFLILAGNTGFPVFLRFSIWVTTKVVPRKSRLNETLHFLLDHPRRCYIYLFPSHQTWFLFTVLIILNTTDWLSFLVLDLGNQAIDSIPPGVRVIDGLLQAAAVRAAGFATVSLAALAPAVKVLYVIMMYISVYPIAMSVRSTNVYEERSLGIYDDDEESLDAEDISLSGGRMTVWSRYLAMHARKQLAFDMWWLGLALFCVCIIERHQLENEGNAVWFNIFGIVFELVSAYGGVGLSLGVPYANYSFSGAFRPLSKLIVCFVMLRGRHRGLPVAIDRAVLLPFEYRQPAGDAADAQEPVSPISRRRPSMRSVPTMASVGVRSQGEAEYRQRAARWTADGAAEAA